MKPCKDCPPESKRPAPHPGPRCATHHRTAVKARKGRAQARRHQETYGLPEGAYAALKEFQGGRCAICQRATGATKALAVDHDHATGAVRGLLCGPDNQLLGRFRDDPDALRRAAEYLDKPPAEQMGLNAVHRDNR